MIFDLGAVPYALLTAQPVWRTHGGELADLCALRPGARVIDLGCGPGESAFGMIDRVRERSSTRAPGEVPGLEVVGVDLSRTMIAIAELRRRFDPAGASTTFVRADAAALPFADASFDAATGHSFLYLLPDAARVMREVARVLKPGGRCAFLEPSSELREIFPAAIAKRALSSPRFVTSMALWRIVSRRYGRFDVTRFASLFRDAGLRMLEVCPTLEGLGLFGTAEKPSLGH